MALNSWVMERIAVNVHNRISNVYLGVYFVGALDGLDGAMTQCGCAVCHVLVGGYGCRLD